MNLHDGAALHISINNLKADLILVYKGHITSVLSKHHSQHINITSSSKIKQWWQWWDPNLGLQKDWHLKPNNSGGNEGILRVFNPLQLFIHKEEGLGEVRQA